jgi:hypothetical protein
VAKTGDDDSEQYASKASLERSEMPGPAAGGWLQLIAEAVVQAVTETLLRDRGDGHQSGWV